MSVSVTKNTAFMTTASILQKVLSFAYFTVIARSIGVAGTGKYFVALSFTTIAVIFIDLGLTNVFVREAAKAKENIQRYLSTILAIKMVLGMLTYGGVAAAVFWLGYDSELRTMVLLSAITMLFDTTHLTLYGAFRALQDLRYEALSIPTSQAFTLVFGSVFLFLHLPLYFLILAFTIPSACNMCFAAIMLYKKHGIRPLPRFEKNLAQRFFRIAVPFALAAVFARIYGYADSILLHQLSGEQTVGWYSIPYKITFAFQFIPLALVASLYPKMSEYAETNASRLPDVLLQGLRYLFLISCPIAIGIAVLAKPIILLLYGIAYLPSVLPLQILIISLIFSFASFPLGALLNATGRQTTQTAIVGVVMVVNIGLNLFLIPSLGATGAAMAAATGNVLLTVLGMFFAIRIVPISIGSVFRFLGTIILSALLMGIGAAYAMLHFSLIPTIVVCAGIYGGCLVATRAVTRQDLRALQHIRQRV